MSTSSQPRAARSSRRRPPRDNTPLPAELAALRQRLDEVAPAQRTRLSKRIEGARRIGKPEALQAVVAEISAQIDASVAKLEQRRASVGTIDFPAQLPVSARREEIAEAIRDHQVVVVAGETGSGKTTQLPKICLELGRGVRGQIGHTQPRRIAARTVSERIAEELHTDIGSAVGYKVRFTDNSSDDTLIKVMTDGILLAEIQHDRMLSAYDTIIIDEAHERSLNIDFILGYLRQLLPKRPDLKVIITSATIDPERFSRHFDNAPIVQVSGRTFPVEARYRPVLDPDDPEGDERDQVQAISDAVDELMAEGPGDILVFLSGEREIRDTAEHLERRKLRDTEVLPLYARLSAAEQHRVFAKHQGRRIVLATNVAETSLTVPGIRYVIDPGTARISRYSSRLKVQRLPIEPISQASANQRKGRCGRVADGICIRLYSEADFDARPEFTDPEILRTNLASVILQMTSLGLGDIEKFGFVEPPDKRNIADGVALLTELGALRAKESDPRKRLTDVGRTLAQLPVDPRMGRMVVEAARSGCVREVMIIAAALSIQDPRERPVEHQQAADAKHARFADPDSDFLAYLNLWNYLREQQKALSNNQFRKLCRAEFLNYLRVREWQDIYAQLRQIAKPLGIEVGSADAEPAVVHMALLSGLLSHIGLREGTKNDYLGARGAKFAVFPGSGLFKKPPRWLMAAELVETSRLWARQNARIEPEWIEPLAGHLVKRTYSEPHWEKKAGAVMAVERVTLYGVPIVTNRKVNYGRIDPVVSRELFIRHALVDGDWETHHKFFAANRALLAEVEELENRARRRDILVDDEELFEFYDRRIPEQVVSARHFDSWWKKTRHTEPDLLNFEKSMLVNDAGAQVSETDFPKEWSRGDLDLSLSYQFEPGSAADGVTVDVPLSVLNQVRDEEFSWLVPGLREELVTTLIRTLPKDLRRHFVPAPNFAKAFLQRAKPADGALLDVLEKQLRAMTGVAVPRSAWDVGRLPGHLRPRFRVLGKGSRVLGEGPELASLSSSLRPDMRATLSETVDGLERVGLTSWTFGDLPKEISTKKAGFTVTGYPALVDEGETVAVRVLESAARQRTSMRAGTRKLLLLTVASPSKYVQRHLDSTAKLVLSSNPQGSVAGLVTDCVEAVLNQLITEGGGPQWTEEGFASLTALARTKLNPMTLDTLRGLLPVLREWQAVQGLLSSAGRHPRAVADVRRQLDALMGKRFVIATGLQRLPHLERYLAALRVRLEKLPQNPDRDEDIMDEILDVEKEYRQFLDEIPPAKRVSPAAREIRWMIEELRVSLFAQSIRTAYPISVKRIQKAMDAIREA